MIDYDAAIDGLLTRWLGLPQDLDPDTFRRGYRQMLAAQTVAAILTLGLFA